MATSMNFSYMSGESVLYFYEVKETVMEVLIATDGSKDATTALMTATRLLRRDGSQLSILGVAPEFYAPRPKAGKGKSHVDKIRDAYRKKIPQEITRRLKETQQMLCAEGWKAEALMEIGSPAEVIVRLAEEYDGTVVGAHGRHERTGPGLGPVASRVVEHAPGTIVVGRELIPGAGLRILLAVDGSLAAEDALRVMVRTFNVASAEITLIHVIEAPWIRLGLEREWFDYPGNVFDRVDPELRLERELRLEAEEIVEEVQSLLSRLGLSASRIIEEGNPATEILGQAEAGEYDLVVLGARGLADIKHKMLGSVSTKVARHAPCSVAVVKSG